MIKNICEVCKKVFTDKNSSNRKRRYCSRKCYRVGFRGKTSPLYGRHYSIQHRKAISGKNNGNWKGGLKYRRDGYVEIRNPKHPNNNGGYVMEHRFVVEEIIGRYLLPTEEFHHLGKKSYNYPHKLMAFTSDSAHHRFEKNPKNVKPEEIIFDGRKLMS